MRSEAVVNSCAFLRPAALWERRFAFSALIAAVASFLWTIVCLSDAAIGTGVLLNPIPLPMLLAVGGLSVGAASLAADASRILPSGGRTGAAAGGAVAILAAIVSLDWSTPWLGSVFADDVPPLTRFLLLSGVSSVAFLGASLVLAAWSNNAAAFFANTFSVVGLALAASNVFNHAHGISFYVGEDTNIAVASVIPYSVATALILPGAAILLAQAGKGWFAPLCDTGLAGETARRHAPVLASIPVVVAFGMFFFSSTAPASGTFGLRVALEASLLFSLSLLNAARLGVLSRMRSEAETLRAEAQRKLLETFGQARAGTFQVDMATMEAQWDEGASHILGLTAHEHRSRDLWSRIVHPEDLARLDAAMAHARETGQRMDCHYRIFRPDGQMRHLNLMGGVIHRHAGDSGLFVGVTVDVTERVLAEAKLRSEKGEADRANAAKSRFLAAASHDLRQPVQGLFLYIGALRERLKGHSALPMVDTVERALDAFKGLLDSLLDISRLDAGLVVPKPTGVALGPMLCRLAKEYGDAARQRGVGFRTLSRRAPTVVADPLLLERMLRNLIENALSHTERGGILVGFRRRGERVRIEVVDTGVGIPEGALEQIWEEFHQISAPERDRARGLGLGLSIVARLSRLMGCEIGVRSVVGRGSRFWIEVVPAADHGCPASSASPANPLSRRPDAAARSGTVLLVEDDTLVRDGFVATLTEWGFKVMVAASQDDAIALAARANPDVIIADYRLAGGRVGTDVVLAVQREVGRPIPALIVTGDTAPERLREAESGGFELMHKPVGTAELRAALHRLLANP